MNVGDHYTALTPDGSEWDSVVVVALDSANKAVVIAPDNGAFAAPEAVEVAGFHSYYGLSRAAETTNPTTWETTL